MSILDENKNINLDLNKLSQLNRIKQLINRFPILKDFQKKLPSKKNINFDFKNDYELILLKDEIN